MRGLEEEPPPSADVFKAIASLILFSIAAVGGLLPLRLQDVGSKVVSCLNTAAGGVFFASAMVHMLPESSETLAVGWGDVFPWGGFLCSFGFLLILCIDQAVAITNTNRKARRGHTLIPTEPPADGIDHHQSKGLLSNNGHRAKTDSEDFAELMHCISPHALLSAHDEALGQPLSSADDETAGDSSGTRSVRHEDGGGMDHPHGHQRSAFSSEEMMSVRGRGGRRAVSREEGEENGGGGCHHPPGERHSNGNHRRGGRGGRGDHGGHGGHSHGLGMEGDGVWVRLALLLALSVHSVMEGLGVGAKSTKAYNLLFAIAVHKGLAAYALGASLLQSGVTRKELTGYVMAFSAMTPAGILLGELIENDGEDDTTGAVCVALAAGTFLYVSLMEVLPPELGSTEHGWAKMGSLIAGFLISGGVGWLVG